MKGILLAGGAGSRLAPLTTVLNKQILPLYDKPIIHYPLSTLMLAGIREVLIISSPEHLPLFEKLLGDGSRWGIQLSYAEQKKPGGLPEAFLIGEEFLQNEPCCLMLGDNIYYGHGLSLNLQKAAQIKEGALIFAYWVKHPERYGVVSFDDNGRIKDLIEKPKKPPSHYAVPGIYFYDSQVVDLAKTLKPSKRGELEITDLNRLYLKQKQLDIKKLGRGIAWLDVGTHDSLLQAANFIQTIAERQGLKIGCLEEIAYRMGFIDKPHLLKLAKDLGGDLKNYLEWIAGLD